MPEAARHRLLQRHHARAGDRGAKFAAPRARWARRCGSCPGHRSAITALQPMPDARAPGPALDLTPALPLAGGWAPLPQRRFQTLPPSQPPRARGAAPGHDPPAGPPQSRAGAGSSGLEGPSHRRTSGLPRIRALGSPHPGPALPATGPALGSPQRTPALPHGHHLISCLSPRTPSPGAQGPPTPERGSSSDGGIRRCCVLLQRGHAHLSSGKTPSSVPSVWF